jgi:short-subunit dehydrogenase involved in D-alanine esterification of teichoic acids
MQKSPDIDCLFLNAGVQAQYDFSQPSECDLGKFLSEINLNFSSMVALTHAFLSVFMGTDKQCSIILYVHDLEKRLEFR